MALIINIMTDVGPAMSVEILTRDDLHQDRTSVVAIASSVDWR
jgi:hypothetical protein